MVDLIIPLGNGSKSDNDELKILLRSVERNGVGVRNVIVVTDAPPTWLTGVRIVDQGDPLPKTKDGNILGKMLAAITSDGVSDEFAWSSDDCALLKPFDFATLPPTYNGRGKEDFPADGSIWQRRVRRTFELLESRGLALAHNYESHMPHRYPTRKVIRALRNVDFRSGIGYSTNTLIHGLLGITGGFDQKIFKETCERESGWRLEKTVVGYNDAAFLHGLREELFRRFPGKSKYER